MQNASQQNPEYRGSDASGDSLCSSPRRLACPDDHGHENRHQKNSEAKNCVQEDVFAVHPEGMA
jgi:hypothetical protein